MKSLKNTKSYSWKSYLQWDRSGMYYYFKSLNKSSNTILCPKIIITDGWQGFCKRVVQREKTWLCHSQFYLEYKENCPGSQIQDLTGKACAEQERICWSVNSFPSQIDHFIFAPINQQFIFVSWSNQYRCD